MVVRQTLVCHHGHSVHGRERLTVGHRTGHLVHWLLVLLLCSFCSVGALCTHLERSSHTPFLMTPCHLMSTTLIIVDSLLRIYVAPYFAPSLIPDKVENRGAGHRSTH